MPESGGKVQYQQQESDGHLEPTERASRIRNEKHMALSGQETTQKGQQHHDKN